MRGGGYDKFKESNEIEEDNNDTFDEFVDEILGDGTKAPMDLNKPEDQALKMQDPTVNSDKREALRALSAERMNLYYQLIKDVGGALGIKETFNSPVDIHLDKLDGNTQEKLDVFSAFYKLGEGCNSEIERIDRGPPEDEVDGVEVAEDGEGDVEEGDEEMDGGAKANKSDESDETVPLLDEYDRDESKDESPPDKNELCSSVPHYKLGIDVSRWPSSALAGKMVTNIIKVTSKNPTFFERLVLIKKHFPTKELCNSFVNAQYRLRRLFEDYVYPYEITPEDDKLQPIEKDERTKYMEFAYKYMALFALQEISRQVVELIKETQKLSGELKPEDGWNCILGKGSYAELYPTLIGSINRDTVARAVCLGETYAIACAGPRKWHKQTVKDGEQTKTRFKAGVIDKKYWNICKYAYDMQSVADKLKYSLVAVIFCYMPNKDEYKIYRLPTPKFKQTLDKLIEKRKKKDEDTSPEMKQKMDQLAQMQTVVKSKIILDEMINVDKFTAVAYDQFSKKYPENTLEFAKISLLNFDISINTINVRFNKEETDEFPVEYKYLKHLQIYIKQKGSLEPLRMKEPIDMKVHRRQEGGRRRTRRRIHKPRRFFSKRSL